MSCKHSICCKGLHIKCDLNGACPFQYWCNKDRVYKSTATKDKCKYYEESEDSNKK